jgi:hypothetical protein
MRKETREKEERGVEQWREKKGESSCAVQNSRHTVDTQ